MSNEDLLDITRGAVVGVGLGAVAMLGIGVQDRLKERRFERIDSPSFEDSVHRKGAEVVYLRSTEDTVLDPENGTLGSLRTTKGSYTYPILGIYNSEIHIENANRRGVLYLATRRGDDYKELANELAKKGLNPDVKIVTLKGGIGSLPYETGSNIENSGDIIK